MIDRITSGNTEATSILPLITHPEQDILTEQKIQSVVRLSKPDSAHAQSLSEKMFKDYPLLALELPRHVKASLSVSGFQESLSERPFRFGFIFKILGTLGAPVARWQQSLDAQPSFWRTLFLKTPVMDHALPLFETLIQALPQATADKLKYKQIQNLVAQHVSEKIWLWALTGQLKSDLDSASTGLYKTVPESIFAAMNTHPELAAKQIRQFITERFKTADNTALIEALKTDLTARLATLDPQLVSLANAVLVKREFGPNFRIDAAKDVGDMDGLRNTPPAKRVMRFEKEVQFIKSFWVPFSERIKSIFPASTIIAELTDFEPLANQNNTVANKARQKLFQKAFTSSPNFTYAYSPLHELVLSIKTLRNIATVTRKHRLNSLTAFSWEMLRYPGPLFVKHRPSLVVIITRTQAIRF